MKVRRIYFLLFLWCVLLMAPGVLIALGLFGYVDMKSHISGAVPLLWVGGYLAQFGIFLWLMAIIGKQNMFWWFAASLLPWAVDWTLPVSPHYGWLWVPILLGFAFWIALAARRTDLLQRNGIRAVGTVLEVFKPWMNVVVNNVYIRRKLRLRIERNDGMAPYEAIFKGLFMIGQIPSPGDRLPLLVDPQNPRRFEYVEGESKGSSGRFDSKAAPPRQEKNFVEELEKLSALRDRGAISDLEFSAAKRKLLKN